MGAEGRVLALDLGDRRIGVASSDALQMIAQARGQIARRGDAETLNEIKEWIRKESAVEVVLGLPLNMDGSMGPRARAVLEFKEIIEGELSVPVLTWDERLSSRQANTLMLEADLSRKKRKKKIDALAAQIILQAYLDSKRST